MELELELELELRADEAVALPCEARSISV